MPWPLPVACALFYWWHIIILQGTCTCQWHMLEIRSLNREGKAPGKFLFSLKVIMTVKLVVKLSGSLGYQQAATTYYNNLQVHHFQHRFYQQKIKSRKQETGVSIHDKTSNKNLKFNITVFLFFKYTFIVPKENKYQTKQLLSLP